MLPAAPRPRGNKRRQRLLSAFDRLSAGAQAQLVDFAEFLAAREEPVPAGEPAPPKDIARPQDETVIAAVRRLSATYHMLDKGTMLHQTSALVSAHVLQGRPAEQVIDELETLFKSSYRSLRDASRS